MITWRAVPGWAGLYEVSDEGQVRSVSRLAGTRIARGRILSHGRSNGGYHTVTFTRPGERATMTVHRVVADAFLGPRPEGWHRAHLNGDKGDNRVSNLAYQSPSENERAKVAQGLNANANKTHCPQGHAYDEANTRIDGRGSRSCKACQRERNARVRQRAA